MQSELRDAVLDVPLTAPSLAVVSSFGVSSGLLATTTPVSTATAPTFTHIGAADMLTGHFGTIPGESSRQWGLSGMFLAPDV